MRLSAFVFALALSISRAYAGLGVEGAGNTNSGSTISSITVSLTTTLAANEIIDVFVQLKGPAGYVTVTSISSSNTSGWALRAQAQSGSTADLEEWKGNAVGTLAGDTLTINFSGNSDFTTVAAFGISGANASAPFDTNGALPYQVAGGPATISTSNANDIVFAGYNFASTPTPTAGAGWTFIYNANYLLVEYQIVSTTQSSLSAAIGTGNTDENNSIGDAIVQASSSVCSRKLRGVGC
jgi:hypothetical protein